MSPNTRQQAAAKELLKRRSALESIEAFRRYLADTGHPDFQHKPAAHHQLIIDALEALKPGDKLLIMAPPGSAKSTWVSIIYAAWHLAKYPGQMILACSHSESLAETFNRRRRAVCLSPQWQALSGVSLDPEASSLGQFLTTWSGGVTAGGAGSGITGLRSDINLLDDPVRGFEQAMSPGQLDKLWEWFLSDFRSRLKPKGIEIVIMTRWAQRDIAGRILELVDQGHEDWKVIRLPMLADADDDPLGRDIGEPLWPQWFTQHQIDTNRRDPLRWLTLYQQTPADDKGTWVSREHLAYEESAPEHLRIVLGIDIALSIGKGDWSSIAVVGIDPDKTMHVLEVWRGRVAPNDLAEQLIEMATRYKPRDIVADDDNMAKVFGGLLTERGKVRNKVLWLQLLPMRGRDKETRSSTLRSLFLSNRVRLVEGAWNAEFVREVLSFPGGSHDDMVDALGLCARQSVRLGVSKPEKKPEPTPEGVFMRDGQLYLRDNLDDMFEQHELSRPTRIN